MKLYTVIINELKHNDYNSVLVGRGIGGYLRILRPAGHKVQFDMGIWRPEVVL